MTKNTFTKQERLTGKTTLDRVFSSGESFFYYPFRLAYLSVEEQDFPCRLLVNVPKRLHKTAVNRNLLKRRIREAYRLQKNDFYEQLGNSKIQLAILYSAKEVLDYKTISEKLMDAENMLIRKLEGKQKKKGM